MSVLNRGTPPVPPFLPDEQEHRRQIAQRLNAVIGGKLNATLDVTLTHDAATTTVNDPRIGYYSAVIPAMATTANGAAAMIAGIYVTGLASETCTIHHHNDAATDQTIRFVIIG